MIEKLPKRPRGVDETIDYYIVEMANKINELVTEANESQKRDKQVREALEELARNHAYPDKMLNIISEILNSTKE